MLRVLFFIFYVLYYSPSLALQSDWSGLDEAKVRIISPITKAGDNPNLYLGLEYKLQEGWKTYWHTPGDGGFPQSLEWNKSTNIDSLEILWPLPTQFEILGLKSIGYKEEVIFPLKIKLKNKDISSKFFFELNYLTCKDICIPGKAELQLVLPSGQGTSTENLYRVEKYLSQIPIKKTEITGLEITDIQVEKNNNNSLISINAYSEKPLLNPNFFLGNDLGLPVVDPLFNFSRDRKNVEVKFYYENFSFENENIDLSILFIDRGVSIEHNEIVKTHTFVKVMQFNHFFISIIFIAMLGGLILNIMPCVLPVLSLKLLSIIKYQQQGTYYAIRNSFFITAFGIIVSFILLSIVLIIIKSIGISIGWGIQFQQPLFLMIISLILFLFSLNLIGVFNFRLPVFLNNSFFNKNYNNSLYNDFFNGFFATILATPCSAPFVGTAVSAAFTQSYIMMITIFFFMGVGMAAPYILAGLFPKTIYLLPKPGQWIIKFKYLLAVLLFGTLFWLGNILLNHFNYIFLIISTLLFVIIFISYRYLRKFKKILIYSVIFIFLSLNFIPQLKVDKINDEFNWINFNQINIQDLINEGNIVFVDITADWCATCQFNKFNVINSKLIKNIFEKNNIIQVRGDWTKPDKKIEKYLNKFNRFGIPFNVIYSANYPKGVILSELLTTDEIIKTIDKLK